MKNNSGKFVVLEGIDGCGKSDQVERLVRFLKARDLPVQKGEEPTKSPYGAAVRALLNRSVRPEDWSLVEDDAMANLARGSSAQEIAVNIARLGKAGKPLSELDKQALFILDRLDDILLRIHPCVTRGKILIWDRYDPSTFAYAAAKRADGIAEIANLEKLILGEHYIAPDLLLLLDLNPIVACERLAAARKTLDIHDRMEVVAPVRKAYLNQVLPFLSIHPFFRYPAVEIIDASPSPEAVFASVCLALQRYGIIS